MGGAAGLNMLVLMVRVKFAAVLIGTLGVGLLANFMVIQKLIQTIAGLGLTTSAVRDIAEASGKDNGQALGRSALTIRRVCWISGAAGALAVVLLAPLLSEWTFGDGRYTYEISLLGIVVFLSNLSDAHSAIIQGMRQIGYLAKIQVASAILGSIVTIIFYALMGVEGVVYGLLSSAFIQLGVVRFYSKRIVIPEVVMTWRESFSEAGGMIRLGLAFMWTALLASLVAYATNAMITHQISLQAVGIFSAAFALSGMFVNFVLTAMGADYYPRLVSVAQDKLAMNLMVNEQTEIGLLLAVPGILITLSFAPWVIQLFYSSEFLPAVDLLQWFLLGCLIRVIQWPMGFLQLALGKAVWFSFSQSLFHVVHVLFVWIGLSYIGVEGVAVAFFMLYMFSLGVIMLIARRLTGFKWSKETVRLILIFTPVVVLVFIASKVLPIWPATIFGLIVSIVVGMLCLRGLILRVGHDHRLTRMACKVIKVKFICGS